MQITNAEIIYDSADKIQVELTISSNRNFQIIVYTFITESKTTKQSRYDRSMQQSITQLFKCPANSNFQFPANHLEFMIVDLLKFQKLKVNPDAQYHNLVIEMKALKTSPVQIIYFYKIDCNELTYHCELHNTKQIIIYNGRIYEVHELFGIQNTPFNPEWNPNTIEDKECIICFFNMINTVLLPCKHMCTCSVCADHIIMNQKIKQCPLCRIDLDNYLTLEIKDKTRQEEQQRQFQCEQQKYYDTIKERKQEQALKQSSILEQLQSKVKENMEAEKIRQEQQRKLKTFNNLEEFHDNNDDIYGAGSAESNEEEQNSRNDDHQFQNAITGKLEQISEEDMNHNRASQEDDQQKYSSNQRSSYDVKHDRIRQYSFQEEKQNEDYQNQPKIKTHSVNGENSFENQDKNGSQQPQQKTNNDFWNFDHDISQNRRSLQPQTQKQQQQYQVKQQQLQFQLQPSFMSHSQQFEPQQVDQTEQNLQFQFESSFDFNLQQQQQFQFDPSLYQLQQQQSQPFQPFVIEQSGIYPVDNDNKQSEISPQKYLNQSFDTFQHQPEEQKQTKYDQQQIRSTNLDFHSIQIDIDLNHSGQGRKEKGQLQYNQLQKERQQQEQPQQWHNQKQQQIKLEVQSENGNPNEIEFPEKEQKTNKLKYSKSQPYLDNFEQTKEQESQQPQITQQQEKRKEQQILSVIEQEDEQGQGSYSQHQSDQVSLIIFD